MPADSDNDSQEPSTVESMVEQSPERGRAPLIRRRRVVSPDGVGWRVGRRWLPWHMSTWKARLEASNRVLWFPADGLDDLEGALMWIAFAAVLVVVIVPVLLFGIELIALGCALAVAIIARVVLGRPWTVFAEQVDRPSCSRRWEVRGWRSSQRLLTDVRRRLQQGYELPADDEHPPGSDGLAGRSEEPQRHPQN